MKKNIKIKIKNSYIRGIIENSKAQKIIILVHGFTGNMNGYKNILFNLSQKIQKTLDIAVLRFNFRGTPDSDGNFRDMTVLSETEDLKEIIKYVKSLGYTEIAILGESMGGTIVTKAYDSLIKIIIYWYPAFDLYNTVFERLFFNENAQNKIKKNGYIFCDNFIVGKEFIEQIPSIKLFDDLKKIKCPVQLIHGDKDKDVPLHQSEKAFKIINSVKEIQIIKGADHCFEYEQKEVIDLTIDFISRYF